MNSNRSVVSRRPTRSSQWRNVPDVLAKTFLISVIGIVICATIPLRRVGATAGDLDLTFGSGGKVTTDFRVGVPDQILGLALQSDGKIVAVGAAGAQRFFGNPNPTASLADFALARYNTDGSLDMTFGTGGKVETNFFNFRDLATSVKIQADGKILVGGLVSNPPFDDDFGLARYNHDGSLDTSFGVGGKVTTGIGTNHDGVNSLLLLPDGKIVAVGVSWRPASDDDFALVSYNSDGSLNTNFGFGGRVVTDMGLNAPDLAIASILAEGKIVVVGARNSSIFNSGRSGPQAVGFSDFAIARYDLNGVLDPAFGTGGIAVTDIFGEDIALAAVQQPDGKIIAAGTKSGVDQDFALVRYNSNGTLDSTFGSGGKVSTDFISHDLAASLILQPNGKIVAAGLIGLTNIQRNELGLRPYAAQSSLGMARYNADGSLDTSFGIEGKITSDFAGLDGLATSTVMQNDGKFLVGGTADISDTDSVFAVARYTLRSRQVIAFTSTRDGNAEIYKMNPDGTSQVRLTNNFAEDTQPSVSPDGTRVAFTSNRDGNEEIYVMNADGTGQTRLTNNVFSDRSPAFSFDGTRIAFTSSRDGNQEIYVMNSNGSAQTRLTNDAAADDQPAFSPDGSAIVFQSWRDQNCEVYLMNLSGGGVTRITNVAPYLDEHPVFSPHGNKIAFFSGRDGYPEIYIMNPDGSAQTRITNATGFDDYPTFSPNGGKIAFRSDRSGDSEIYSMNADGTNVARLTFVAGEDSMPSWGGEQTSAMVTVGGKVLTAHSLPLRNAVVSLIDAQNVRRVATTSSFGLYSFENVRIAETYIIIVSSKRYRFAPRIMEFYGSAADLDFIGLE